MPIPNRATRRQINKGLNKTQQPPEMPVVPKSTLGGAGGAGSSNSPAFSDEAGNVKNPTPGGSYGGISSYDPTGTWNRSRIASGGNTQAEYDTARASTRNYQRGKLEDAKAGLEQLPDTAPRNIFQQKEGGFAGQFDPSKMIEEGQQRMDERTRYEGDTPKHLAESEAGRLAGQRTVSALEQEGPSANLAKLQGAGDAALARSAQSQMAGAAQDTVQSGNLGQGAAKTSQQRAQANVAGQIMANEAQKVGQTMTEKDTAMRDAQAQALAGGQFSEQQFQGDQGNILSKYGMDLGASAEANRLGFEEYGMGENMSREARDAIRAQAASGDPNAQRILYEGGLMSTSGEGISEADKLRTQQYKAEDELSMENQVKKRALEQQLYSMSPEYQAYMTDLAMGDKLYQTTGETLGGEYTNTYGGSFNPAAIPGLNIAQPSGAGGSASPSPWLTTSTPTNYSRQYNR